MNISLSRFVSWVAVLFVGSIGLVGTSFASGCDASDEATLKSAIADTSCNEVTLTSSFTVTGFPWISIDRALTLNGGNNTLSVDISTATYAHHADGILINSDNVTVKDITVNNLSSLTDNNKGYGIQVYQKTGASLENVTVSNFKKGGIVVNGASLTLNGTITLTDNAWGGIDVSKGAPTSTLDISSATINFSGDNFVIWSDDDTANVIGGSYAEVTYDFVPENKKTERSDSLGFCFAFFIISL